MAHETRSLAVFHDCHLFISCVSAEVPKPAEGDFIVHNFQFKSGGSLPDLKLHYSTYGTPVRDAKGRVTNAVMVLHGTGGSGHQFVNDRFAGVLFGAGQLLDASRYFIILPDNIGHGQSSKPSDGLHSQFPALRIRRHGAGQYLLLTQGLKVDHLRLLMGTSMGCMHSWIWLEEHPDFMDAAMPLACLPVQIAGRNRIFRKMIMDSIRQSPGLESWRLQQQPRGLQGALNILLIMGSSPLQMQEHYPTRDQADADLDEYIASRMAVTDANDLLYAVDSSRNYDPSAHLETSPRRSCSSTPPTTRSIPLNWASPKRKSSWSRRPLCPAADHRQTRGHGTHTQAAVWKQYLAELLAASQ